MIWEYHMVPPWLWNPRISSKMDIAEPLNGSTNAAGVATLLHMWNHIFAFLSAAE